MKKKTLNFVLCSAMLLTAALTSCTGGKKPAASTSQGDNPTSTQSGQDTPAADGFISLANKNANAPLDAQGYYTYGNQKFKTKKEFKTTYTTEPTDAKFNYLVNQWTYNSYHYCNMVDGLVENDKYGNIVGALAESYKEEKNADGTQTWTFKLKKGVKWVDNETGEEYAEVKANDFVAAMKYVLTPITASNTAGIVMSVINNAEEYYNGEVKDFSQVGVKAVDDYTVAYTTYEVTPYFLSQLTYSPFLPVNEDYLDEMGTDFGSSEDNILVNGAFRITEHTENQKFVYEKNDKYWDKDHVYVDKITRTFVPGTATPDTTRKWYEAGTIDSFTVNSDDTEGYAKYVTGGEEGTGTQKNPVHDECNGVLQVGDATYVGYFNYNRQKYAYSVSSDAKTDAKKALTVAAILNKDFRLGFLHGMDALSYLKRYNPAEPYAYLARAYTNRELASANNKDYVDYVCDVYNKKQGTTGVNLTGIEQGGDPVHDAAKAGAYFDKAKAALKALGYTDADFPVQVDILSNRNVKIQAYEKLLYSAIEDASNGLVKICYNVPSSDDENTDWGSVSYNYDFSMFSGWGPDYADPKTYLATYSLGGDCVNALGFTQKAIADPAKAALSKYGVSAATVADYEKYVLGDYDAKYQVGAAIVDADKTVERFEKFAEAEYSLIYEEGIVMPWLQQNGYAAVVARTVARQAGKASYGLTSDKFKNVVVTENTITKAQRQGIDATYEAGK